MERIINDNLDEVMEKIGYKEEPADLEEFRSKMGYKKEEKVPIKNLLKQKLIEIRFIKDLEDLNNKGESILKHKKGDVVEASKENAGKFIKLGYAEYVEDERKTVKEGVIDKEEVYISKEDYERLMSQGKKEDMERLLDYEMIKFKEKKIAKGKIKVQEEYATAYNTEFEEEPDVDEEELIPKPEITLPQKGKSVSTFAEEISNLIKDKNTLFYRPNSNDIVEIGDIKIKDKNNKTKNFIGFIKMEPKRFITLIERYTNIGVKVNTENEGWIFLPKSLGAEKAGVTLASQILIDSLPQITRIFTVPIPIIYNNELTFPKIGYDIRFNSWLTPDAPVLEEMPLEEAKKLLEEIYKEFCFDDPRENTLSMAISALLTPYLRGLFSEFNVRTPIFFYIANQKRAGKDFCAGVTGIVHEGMNIQETPINTGERSGNGNEELRKKFTAALIAGRKRLHFSNNKGHINNAVFEGIVTSPTHSDRILGGNEMINLDNEIDFSLSGNDGVTYTPDFADRCRIINLFYAGEDANERVFERPGLHFWVKENRSKILSALYSLVKNWIDKGSKPGTIPFASFHEWSETCGGIMESAGYVNPCITDKINQNLSGDTETQNMKQIFELCYEKHPDEWIKKEKIYEIVRNDEIFPLEETKHKSLFMIKFRRYIRRILSNIHLQSDETLKKKADHTFKFTKKEEIKHKKKDLKVNSKGSSQCSQCSQHSTYPTDLFLELGRGNRSNTALTANTAKPINMTDNERLDYAELNEGGLSDEQIYQIKMCAGKENKKEVK